MNDDSLAFSPENFSGFARLFPLPNLVMFPHVMQAMHIFEPRYRSLFEEAISDDKHIALGVLAPGWEVDYEGRPALESMACLCRIATYQRTPEGTYNVLLLGVRRIQLQKELPPTKPFRVAEAQIIEDHVPPNSSAEEIVRLQILKVSKTEGDFIVDPFMGSGSTIKAANELGLKSLGIELDKEMFYIANDFINV